MWVKIEAELLHPGNMLSLFDDELITRHIPVSLLVFMPLSSQHEKNKHLLLSPKLKCSLLAYQHNQ